jgi:hypothetical protein
VLVKVGSDTHGILNEYYKVIQDYCLYGTGQGSGASPLLWLSLVVVLLTTFTILDFNPVDDCPLWLALIHDVTGKSRVNIYNQWIWLTLDDILALQYCPDPSKQKIVPLSQGYHTHVTRFKAMYSELQLNLG